MKNNILGTSLLLLVLSASAVHANIYDFNGKWKCKDKKEINTLFIDNNRFKLTKKGGRDLIKELKDGMTSDPKFTLLKSMNKKFKIEVTTTKRKINNSTTTLNINLLSNMIFDKNNQPKINKKTAKLILSEKMTSIVKMSMYLKKINSNKIKFYKLTGSQFGS